MARHSELWLGQVRWGRVRQASPGKARSGQSRQGRQGAVRHGEGCMVWPDMATQARLGVVWPGKVGRDMAGEAMLGA
jgi:hypothetical protein